MENKYIMPAEWEKHEATWLAWPNDDDYFGDRISNIENTYVEIVFALHKGERVKLLVLDESVEKRVKELLSKKGVDLTQVEFFEADYIDVWVRDYGPTFVNNNSKKSFIKWNYDGYGGKFPELLPDNDVFNNLTIDASLISSTLDMEGGAIDVNGSGMLLTTKECLVDNRNKNKTKEEIEKELNNKLGTKKVIWLNMGLLNDHTDGHIDEVARFVSKNKILLASEENTNDENHARLKENYEILSSATNQDEEKFEIVKLPVPHMIFDNDQKHKGMQAPASYTNFYIGNKVVLVPIFNDPNDENALKTISECFPEREVKGINCVDLAYGGGSIHCITQQEPE